MNPNLKAFARRSAECTIGGVKFVVRELPSAADVKNLADDPDHNYKMIVMCAFNEDGVTPSFTEADIPDLKAEAAMAKLIDLIKAISSVNGMDIKEEAKN